VYLAKNRAFFGHFWAHFRGEIATISTAQATQPYKRFFALGLA
jgi:hypothetical protein